MGTLFVDKLDPQSGTSLEIGSSGDTITIPSGATLDMSNGTMTLNSSMKATPMFAATGASNAISSATYVKAQNGTELFDTDGDYDNSTNYRFTPSVAGKYYLSNRISVNPDSNMQYIFAAIYKNGSRIAEMHQGYNNTDPVGNNYFSIELSMIAEANGSSDYFEAYAYMHQNGDFRSTSGENLFSGFRIIGA